jgi:GNAT superfamily N-acetyltransferase
MSSLIIREIRQDDEDDWRRLWTEYLVFYNSSVSKDVYQESFARLLNPAQNEFRGLIAEFEGRPSGLVHYLFHRHMWKVENTCYLQDLYAEPASRGRGVGRALIEAVYDAADQAGAPSVYWLTQDFNTTARQLYDRVGKLSPFIKYTRS